MPDLVKGGSLSRVLFSRKSDEWATPQDVFDALDAEFHFELDPCANAENAKCRWWISPEQDGLAQTWAGASVFVNPPYSKVAAWVAKASEEASRGATVVMLIPVRTDTRWFHDHIYGKAEVRFIKGRLRFQGAKWTAPFPSMVVVFRPQAAEKAA